MNNTAELSESAQQQLDVFVQRMQGCLGENLRGIYLHGSLAMGGFNPSSSDADLLIVVGEKLSVEQRKELAQLLRSLPAPGRGYELSIVTVESLKNFAYPTPCEHHFDYSQESPNFAENKTDPDLAAHFVITRSRGVRLFGPPIVEVFPEVPRWAYLDSLLRDAEESYGKIVGTPDDEATLPGYAILNFCRVLAFIQDGLIQSKLEGGEWGLKTLPEKYHLLISEALKNKTDGSGRGLDARLVKEFAGFAMKKIRGAARQDPTPPSALTPKVVQ